MHHQAKTLQLLMTEGQDIGHVPRELAPEFLRIFRYRFPDRVFALLGDGDVTLIVHPPLCLEELQAWQAFCGESTREGMSWCRTGIAESSEIHDRSERSMNE